MIMKFQKLPSTFIAIGTLMACSSLVPASSHALEVTAVSTESESYNSAYSAALMRLEFLRQRLAKERAERAQADIDLRKDIKTQMDEVDNRVTALDQRVTSLSDQVDADQVAFLKEIADLKTDVTNLRNLMNSEYSKLDSRINALRNHMNSNVKNLQNQINEINSGINDLNSRMTAIRNRLSALENFADELNSRLNAMRACMANGSCVGYRKPRVELREISVWGGDGGFSQQMTYYNTGLPTSVWQYCSLSGGTNVSRRDFNIYESGGYWIVANEMDNLWFGDQEGQITARCMRVY